MLASLLVHPRRALGAAAERPRLAAGGVAVGATGIICLGLELLAAAVGRGGSAAVGLSIAVPLMLAVFWLDASSHSIAGTDAPVFPQFDAPQAGGSPA